MADNILRLKVESQEYDSKLKEAARGLTHYADQCRKVGGTLEFVEKETLDYVRAVGQMETTSRTATGKLAEMKKTFVELSAQYKQLTNEEKSSPFGKALSQSLDQLKTRINSSKKDLEDISREMGTAKTSSFDFSSVIGSLGSQFGIDTSMLSGLTAGTVAYTAAIGAAAAAAAYAAKEFAKYNDELAKQQQITSVTTGLKGEDAGNMTASARSLSRVYGTDFREVINAANTLMTQFGQTGDEAIQLLRDGMQGMIQGDGPKLLQMIQQYAPAFRDAGVSASQLIAVIQNSEGGIFTDQNMNAIVMGIKNIRLMTKATSDALAQLGIDGQKMSEQLGNGTLTIFDALKQVASAIENTNSSSQEAGQVMQQVFGRQGAMAGTKLGEAIATLNLNLEDTKKQTGDVGESLSSLELKTYEFEKRLMSVFGIDGWDTMNNQIKEGLLVSLNKLLIDLEGVRDFLNDINIIGNNLSVSGIVTFFADIAKEVYLILNPLMEVVRLIGYLQNLANQGRPSTGSTHELTPEERKINELASRGGGMSLDDIVVTPTKPVVTTPKKRGGGGSRTTQEKTEEQLNSDKIKKLSQEYIKASDDRRKAIEAEIKTLQDRNAEIRKLMDAAQGKLPAPEGSQKALGEELSKLQQDRQLLSDPIAIEIQDQAIQEVQDKIDRLNGKKVEVELAVDSRSAFEKLKDSLNIELAEQNMQVDTTTLQTLIKTAIQNGIDELDPDFASLQEKMNEGMNIPDETWQALQDEINEKLKELGIEPIKIDFKTGNITKDGEKAKDSWQDAARAVQSVGTAMQNIEDPAAKVAGTVLQAVANVALGYANALTMVKETGGPWGWIAFAATGLATMMTTISAIHSATGYAEGGMVKGNSYSGDNLQAMIDGGAGGFAGLNSGEIVLNRAAQGNLASQLEGTGANTHLSASVSGEQILLVANRTTRRQGKGELVTWR